MKRRVSHLNDVVLYLQKHRNRFDTPQDYIVYLGNHQDLSVHKIYTCMESLRIALTNNPLSWVHDFVCEGLNQVLNILNECYRRFVSLPDLFTTEDSLFHNRHLGL